MNKDLFTLWKEKKKAQVSKTQSPTNKEKETCVFPTDKTTFKKIRPSYFLCITLLIFQKINCLIVRINKKIKTSCNLTPWKLMN